MKGRDRGRSFARALGFTRDKPPCCATLHYVFAALDAKAFEVAIATTNRGNWVVAAKLLPDNPYDGHTLSAT